MCTVYNVVKLCFMSLSLCSPQVVETLGMNLKPGVVVIESIKSKSNPTFCKIEQMFMVNNELLLGVMCLDTVEYSAHYHSWVVQEKENHQLVLPANHIPTRQVLTLHPVRDTLYKWFFNLEIFFVNYHQFITISYYRIFVVTKTTAHALCLSGVKLVHESK